MYTNPGEILGNSSDSTIFRATCNRRQNLKKKVTVTEYKIAIKLITLLFCIDGKKNLTRAIYHVGY